MPALSNAKYEIFAQHIARGEDHTRAYVTAGFAENRGNAFTLANKTEVRNRINQLKAIAAARVDVTAEVTLAELARIAFVDISQIFTYAKGKLKLKDMSAWSLDLRAAIREIRHSKDGTVIRFHDKVRALELLAKHLGLTKENVELHLNVSLADLVNGSYRLEHGEAMAPAIEHQGQPDSSAPAIVVDEVTIPNDPAS